MEVFLESIELFLGQNEQTNTCMRKNFNNFSSQNKASERPPRSTQKYSLSTMAIQHI